MRPEPPDADPHVSRAAALYQALITTLDAFTTATPTDPAVVWHGTKVFLAHVLAVRIQMERHEASDTPRLLAEAVQEVEDATIRWVTRLEG